MEELFVNVIWFLIIMGVFSILTLISAAIVEIGLKRWKWFQWLVDRFIDR